jgi:cytochrome c oxidase cbb3-type subunit 1
MKIKFNHFSTVITLLMLSVAQPLQARDTVPESEPDSNTGMVICILLIFFLLVILLIQMLRISKRINGEADSVDMSGDQWLSSHINDFDSDQLNKLINPKKSTSHQVNQDSRSGTGNKAIMAAIGLSLASLSLHAQTASADNNKAITSPGMIIMLVLILIPLLTTIFFVVLKLNRLLKKVRYQRVLKEATHIAETLKYGDQPDAELYERLVKRKKALDYHLNNYELAGEIEPEDKKGLLRNINEVNTARFIAPKKKAAPRHNIDPRLVRLILWFLGTATLWLVVGTSIGEYMGIKFVSPDADHISWLSFGRLRPVHVNMVFWGWSSLAMIGLGYYVVTTVSNAPVASIKSGYQTLILMNSAVLAGTICLMAGINNGGGEYREYIWPVMGLFAIGIVVTLINYIKTIGRRKTNEIYISNWYIIAAMMFILVIVTVGYTPWWQNGLGETIIQGYYMHQAVGMWFMLFSLGLMYYFLPQQLNTPIYSYSLGILAFWSQILFYTLVGTHHFLFSAIPWWLQTVAIVASMGMLIPVFSGTTNFLMTFRGNYSKTGSSYTLPFYLVGILFYFTGSTQGTAEAFRGTNLIWHFTDFTVAHSHMTMYGIIAFMLWGCIYTLVPRLTGKEPKQSLVGAHFWMALIGVLFYTISLMIGGTLKGMSWVAGKPFIDGVILMAPYWLWRAIGGSLMWASHLVFAWNMYTMVEGSPEADVSKEVIEQLIHLPVHTANQ